jgi:tripartite-type tricarboxylate transporter receptor subunit TctC
MQRIIAAAAFTAAVLLNTAAPAADWPAEKPVRIIIGFGAGGGTDVATRILADGLSENLHQQFIIENKPGAGGSIAGGLAAKSPNDGYTLLAISMGHSVSAVMVKNVPYDPVKDFAMVGIFTNSAFVVAVPKNSPATDMKSLIAYVNKQLDRGLGLDPASDCRGSAPAHPDERAGGVLPHHRRGGHRVDTRRRGLCH